MLLVIDDLMNLKLQKFEKLINENIPLPRNFNEKIKDKIAYFYLISCSDINRYSLMDFVSNFTKFKLVWSKIYYKINILQLI